MLTAEHGSGRIALARTGAAPLLVQHAAAGRRPFIHPILAPDGHGVLTEDAPAHHPWQHGLYVGLNDVNGIGFWLEGLRERDRPTDGTFHPRPLAPPRVSGTTASWTVEDEWRAPDGAPLLVEAQGWSFQDAGSHYVLDLRWTLRAQTDLTFGQSAYGGLFLRMPFRAEVGGSVLTSEGAAPRDGARARWAAVCMPVAGRPAAEREAGVAILDHPDNPEHPMPWRIDNQLGICPSRSIAGAWRLDRGNASTSRYRLLVYCGPADRDWIDGEWQQWRTLAATS